MSVSRFVDNSSVKGRGRLMRACEEALLSGTDDYGGVSRLMVAVDEILANIGMHGYGEDTPGPVKLSVEWHADEAELCISDEAPRYDPLETPEADTDLDVEEREIGGLGIHLVLKMIDHVGYRYDAGNILTLRHRLAAAANPNSE